MGLDKYGPHAWPGTAQSTCASPSRTGHYKTTTVLAGLRPNGMIAPFVIDGAINPDAFETYVAEVLVPELRAGDTVVMDNLSSHKGPRVRELIEAAAQACCTCALQPRLQSDQERAPCRAGTPAMPDDTIHRSGYRSRAARSSGYRR